MAKITVYGTDNAVMLFRADMIVTAVEVDQGGGLYKAVRKEFELIPIVKACENERCAAYSVDAYLHCRNVHGLSDVINQDDAVAKCWAYKKYGTLQKV